MTTKTVRAPDAAQKGKGKAKGREKKAPKKTKKKGVAGVPRDLKTGEQMWRKVKDKAAKVDTTGMKMPNVDIGYVTDRLLWIDEHHIKPLLREVIAMLSALWQKRFTLAHDELIILDHALHWAYGQYLTNGLPADSRAVLVELIEEANQLSALGKRWINRIATFKPDAAAVRDQVAPGATTDDTVDDLEVMGSSCSANHSLIAKMQPLVDDPAERLTPKKIERMKELATTLRRELARPAEAVDGDETDWRAQVIGLFALLEQNWTIVRGVVVGYLLAHGRLDDAAMLSATLRGMSQVGRVRAPDEPDDEAKDEPAEQPVVEADGEIEDDEELDEEE